MHIKNRRLILAYRILLIICTAWGIACELGIPQGMCNLNKLVFYTLLSNLACLVFFIAAAIVILRRLVKTGPCGDATVCPRLKAALTMLITVTFLVYHFVLAPGFRGNPNYDFWSVRNLLIHYIGPVMVILDWLLFDRKNTYRRYDPFLWLLPGLAYLAFILIRAQLVGVISLTGSRYPYFFLDADAIGWPMVLVCIAGLLVFFILLGYVFLLINKLTIQQGKLYFGAKKIF